ncbi:hypothetical protein J8M97_01935 [Gordonia polyisoprenivorans]|uniref:hypothetical protein n=1 Tax=Gordonia polyisoprenivorans TaxID=84595 RepID=UPI00037DD6AD|nr:hypothetical protein [Gordonia polyisoprenivorans]QUD83467.1 hypothetical protein J8M97_01935 [Gordonia polyisoprenivorans]UZF55575.1 hypothetical protein LH935_23180 [Gordonia polyisoprenivorans]
MSDHILTDDQIAALTSEDRRDLIVRLARPLDDVLPDPVKRNRIRRARIGLMAGGAIGLIPWIVFLGLSLPVDYVAHNWSITWVGFDVLLVAMMATTAVLAWQRRQMLVLAGFATGVLLICDAWFDIMTAAPADRWISLLTAAFGELPLAALLIVGTMRLIRLTGVRLWLIEPHSRLWHLPMLFT